MGFGTGFSEGFLDAAQKKIDQHDADEKQKNEELRNGLWKIAYDTSGQYNDATKQNAQEQLQKLYGPQGKKGIQKVTDIFSRFHQQLPTPQGSQQGGGFTENLPSGQPAPGTAGSQPSALPMPTGVRAQPQPAQQTAQAAQSNIQAQLPTPPPVKASTPANGGFSLPPVTTQADIDAANAKAASAAREAETFKTNEGIRARKQELQDAAEQSRATRTQQIQDINGNPDLSDEEKRQGRLQAFGITPQPQTLSLVEYQDTDGKWHPAQHDSKTGRLFEPDGKTPLDTSKVQDVRDKIPEGPKPTGELATRLEAQGIIDNPDKHSKTELQAAKDTLKSLNTKQTAAIVNLNNKQSDASGGGMTDDELRSLAQVQIQTGSKPSFGMGRSQERSRYNKILAQEYTKDPNAATAVASFKAGQANLLQLTKLQGQISAFDNAFKADLQNAREAAQDVPRTSMRRFNSVAQLVMGDWTDDPALARLAVASQTAVNQYSRLVSSASGGGTSTDTARKEAFGILDKAMANGSFNAALDQMDKEAGNRVEGINKEIDTQKKALSSPRAKQSLPSPDSSSKPKIKILSVQ